MYAWPPNEDKSAALVINTSNWTTTSLPVKSRRKGQLSPLSRTASSGFIVTKESKQVTNIQENDRTLEGLSVIIANKDSNLSTLLTSQPAIQQVPLWTIVPGVGALHGSTASSTGIHISSISAINLAGKMSGVVDRIVKCTKDGQIASEDDLRAITMPPPVQAISQPLQQEQKLSGAEWPAHVRKVSVWRKGRKELMEDALDEIEMLFAGDGIQDVEQRIKGFKPNEDQGLLSKDMGEGAEASGENELLAALLG